MEDGKLEDMLVHLPATLSELTGLKHLSLRSGLCLESLLDSIGQLTSSPAPRSDRMQLPAGGLRSSPVSCSLDLQQQPLGDSHHRRACPRLILPGRPPARCWSCRQSCPLCSQLCSAYPDSIGGSAEALLSAAVICAAVPLCRASLTLLAT